MNKGRSTSMEAKMPLKILPILFLLILNYEAFALDKTNRVSFHPSLMTSIENGDKTATIRARHRDYYDLGPGLATSRDGQQIEIEIEEVFLTNYLWQDDAITPEILERENMRDTTEKGFYQLYEALLQYYPDFEIGSEATVIFFKRR